MEAFFSVIVPCYNAAAFLRPCLDALLAQRTSDWEAILVEDGSGDDTGAICRAYVAQDKRFRLLSQSHLGVSPARNAGIRAARGAYLVFLDADDLLRADFLTALKERIVNGPCDLCVTGISIRDCRGRWQDVTPEPSCREKASLLEDLLDKNLLGYACNKAVRRELVRAQNLFFDEGLIEREDQDFFFRLWPHCQAVQVVSRPLYCYLQRPASASQARARSLEISGAAYLAGQEQALEAVTTFWTQQGADPARLAVYRLRFAARVLPRWILLALRCQSLAPALAAARSSPLLSLYRKSRTRPAEDGLRGLGLSLLLGLGWPAGLRILHGLCWPLRRKTGRRGQEGRK